MGFHDIHPLLVFIELVLFCVRVVIMGIYINDFKLPNSKYCDDPFRLVLRIHKILLRSVQSLVLQRVKQNYPYSQQTVGNLYELWKDDHLSYLFTRKVEHCLNPSDHIKSTTFGRKQWDVCVFLSTPKQTWVQSVVKCWQPETVYIAVYTRTCVCIGSGACLASDYSD